QPVAQAQHRGVVEPLDDAVVAFTRFVTGADEFDDADLRNGEALPARLHDQGGDDGEGQRDLDGEGRALAGHALEVYRAADLLDVGLDHVHADAAAGDGGNGGGGGEAGAEDEALDLVVGYCGQFGLGRQAVGDRLGADPVDREAAAVIRDFDDDLAALVEGVQGDMPDFRLAGGAAFGGCFKAVVAAVAHHVRQRVLDHLQHLAVQLGLGAEHGQLDLLVHVVRQVAHQPRQLVPGNADRLHAGLHHAFLQVGGDVRQPLQGRGEGAVFLGTGQLEQLVAGQHQLADQGHEVLKHVDGDADRLSRGRT